MSQPIIDDTLFTARLRQASRRVHSLSNSLVSGKLVFALSDETLYGAAIANFYAIYAAMERAVEAHAKDAPELAALAPLMPTLRRAPGFEKDLEYYLGDDWRAELPAATPGLRAYLDHIDQIAAADPGLLAAHIYTQYGAMASGGQIMRRAVLRSFRPQLEGEGVVALSFTSEPAAEVKKKLFDAVNALGASLPEERRQQLEAEHIKVFELNNGVLRDFKVGAAGVAKTALRLAPTVLGYAILLAILASFLWWFLSACPHATALRAQMLRPLAAAALPLGDAARAAHQAALLAVQHVAAAVWGAGAAPVPLRGAGGGVAGQDEL